MRRRFWVAAAMVAAYSAAQYFFPAAPKPGPLMRLEPPSGRVVVFAPHSDDETLATGGLLQQVQAAGNQAQVVLVTGGDAFKVAAEAYFHRQSVSQQQMIEFGRHRLGESKAALDKLGIPADQLMFLGYPDQMLGKLWTECWRADHPCTSPTTGASAVPYAEARSYGAPFAGERLLADIREILRTAHPDTVVYPHPNEAHVDHWALSNFVSAALEDLRRTEPGWRPPDERLYLVHRGDWPAPKGYRPDAQLLPPDPMTGGMTTWEVEKLTPEQVGRKGEAVHAYHSQVLILRRYMDSFIRSNELFGKLSRVQLPAAHAGPCTPAAGDSPPWTCLAWVEVITDPRADTLARKMEASDDMRAVWAAQEGDQLWLAVRVDGPPKRLEEIRLNVSGFRPGAGWGSMITATVLSNGTHSSVAGGGDVQGNWARVSIPLAALQRPASVMVNAETRVDSILIDRSAWRPLALDGR